MFNSKYFKLGQVVVTHGINDAVAGNKQFAKEVFVSMNRHCNKDWGDLCVDDKALNDEAVRTGADRIFSAYKTCIGKIYIITEWDRSATTVLFPSEY